MKQPTVDCTLKPFQCSGVKHSVGKVIPHSNLLENWTGLREQSIVGCFPECFFSSIFHNAGACGVAKATYKILFSLLGPVPLFLIILIIIILLIINITILPISINMLMCYQM